MLAFVKNKILSKKWMVISLLIGNILLISIAACSPMYSDAVLQRMLNKNMVTLLETTGKYPGLIEIRSNYDHGIKNKGYDKVEATAALAAELAAEEIVPVADTVTIYYKSGIAATHEAVSGRYDDTFNLRLEAAGNLENHITLLDGELPKVRSGEPVLEAIVSEKTMVESNLFVGEVLTLERLTDGKGGKPYQVVITGVFTPADLEDPYWVTNPNRLSNYMYVNQEDFVAKMVADEAKRQDFGRVDYIIMDYQQIKGTQVYDLLETLDDYGEDLSDDNYKITAYEMLDEYLIRANQLDITLLVLQVPTFMMLAAFILMVSGQMLGMEQNEISVIKSRGASKKQILTIYLLQSTLIAVVSFVIAMPLSYMICQVVGSANSFLEFVSRKSLPARFAPPVWFFGVGAVVLSIMTMVLPAVKYSKVGIVDHKRSRHKQKKPLWQTLFLDIVLLGVSGYGLYSYHNQAEFMASRLENGAALDPLLYLCSAMFILGAALFVTRIFPLLIKLIFSVFKKAWSPAMYASFLRMLRSRSNQNFIMIFLILTMALGIFSAETAHTINSNAEDEIRHENGADLVVAESWSTMKYGSTGSETEVVSTEPDFYKYVELQDDAAITKVLRRPGIKVSGKKDVEASLMAINTQEFGQIANMKDGLLSDHWYHYLNAMSQDARGVLVSTSFRDEMGYKLGDVISFRQAKGESYFGVIYGFVDYWPGMVSPSAGEEGISYFIIANLAQIQAKWGIQPYEIWMKNLNGSSQYIYDFAEKHGLAFETFIDTNADIIELKNDPVFQATNGVLTVSFIVILVLCSVGFLIYWILSIQSRALQFGIFRAMGMTMGEVLGMLFNEQIFISGISIASGIVIGKVSSQLFVPMIQAVFSGGNELIPLEIQTAIGDTIKLYIVVAVVMIVCMVILGWIIKKIKIAQALKLGED